jgi:glycosyltransferase involved in cell wall biosynthesis
MPKLSIITINYNNLEGLKRTVDSVLNQTWKEFEYIVIDGGSTDGSAEYIESKSEHIDYWISEPDKGIYNAMNKGIVKATGEYLLFLNSGDHFFTNSVLQENNDKIANYDLIYFNIQNVGENFSKIISYPAILRFSDLFFNILSHQATFFRKNLFKKVGLYDENLKIVSDWKFMIVALFKYHCSYLKVDETLSTYYLDGISSFMENREIVYKERDLVLNSDFKGYVEDINQLLELRTIVSNLRKSKKIGWLVKLGLIHKF